MTIQNHSKLKVFTGGFTLVLFFVSIIGGLLGFLSQNFDSRSKAYEPTSNHLQYFGYYYGANAISQLKDHSNIIFARNSDDVRKIINGSNLKIIYDLTWVLWKPVTDGSARWEPQDNWRQLWALELEKTIKPNAQRFAAIYPIDEPDMNSNRAKYELIAGTIKDSLQQAGIPKPIVAVFTPHAPWLLNDPTALTHKDFVINSTWIENKKFVLPLNVLDWVGFDEYGCWDNDCIGGLSLAQKSQNLLSVIRTRKPQTKLVLITDGYKSGSIPPTSNEQLKWVERNKKIFELCKGIPECNSLLVFLYTSVPAEKVIGLDQMSVVFNSIRSIGYSISNNLAVSPTPFISPIILNNEMTVSSSGEYSNFTKDKAVNRDAQDSGWVSGSYAPQWIEFKMNKPEKLAKLQLYVNQSPTGSTTHRVLIAGADKKFKEVAAITQVTKDAEKLTKQFNPSLTDVYFVKIETTKSPSWIAWREIELYRQ